jgi:exo-beta-1,3-glucanase (GH17 family)
MTRPSAWLLPVLALLLLAAGVGWWWPNRVQPQVGPPVARLNSVSFAPFRAGQSPLEGVFPSAAEVDADMALLAPLVRAARSYASVEGSYDTAEIAARHGVKLWQGIWLGGDRAQNQREIARAILMARTYPDTVERVVVGNEVLLRRDLPPEELIAAIEQVRAAVRQPVTYADVWEVWEQFPQVADHVDIVTIHLLPYWEDTPTGVDRAIAHVEATWRRIARRFPGKPIAIGETGWPSAGRWRADAAPGVVAQARFVRGFLDLARREGLDYNLIEAFDQGWKYRNEGVVGANWGLWTEDRQPKPAFSGPVSEDANWPHRALLGAVLAVALLATGLARPALNVTAQCRLAVLAVAAGTALAWAAASWDIAYDPYLQVAAVGNLLGQAILAVLLMRRAAVIFAGGTLPPSRNGAHATASVRSLLRLRLPEREALFDDFGFVFLWAATVLQLLLLVDPRYRDMPTPVFAIPLLTVLARLWLRDLPLSGGGREEAVLGVVLLGAALGSAVQEGPLNHPSLAWSACAVVLALPALLRLRRAEASPG